MSAPALEVRAVAPVTAGANRRARFLTPAGAVFLVMGALLLFGWQTPTERYITPQRGLGYALGIVGGSLMLLLFIYSARKHFRWLAFLGPTVHPVSRQFPAGRYQQQRRADFDVDCRRQRHRRAIYLFAHSPRVVRQ